MNANESKIPEKTIATFARGFFKESLGDGFKKVDYLRFVNSLLEIALSNSKTLENNNHHLSEGKKKKPLLLKKHLPINGERIRIRSFNGDDINL